MHTDKFDKYVLYIILLGKSCNIYIRALGMSGCENMKFLVRNCLQILLLILSEFHLNI